MIYGHLIYLLLHIFFVVVVNRPTKQLNQVSDITPDLIGPLNLTTGLIGFLYLVSYIIGAPVIDICP